MFANESENVFCDKCGRIYFKYAPLNVPFCVCNINIVFSVDAITHVTKKHITSIPHAFYEAFKNEKEFD